jgi:hypothetical protein
MAKIEKVPRPMIWWVTEISSVREQRRERKLRETVHRVAVHQIEREVEEGGDDEKSEGGDEPE